MRIFSSRRSRRGLPLFPDSEPAAPARSSIRPRGQDRHLAQWPGRCFAGGRLKFARSPARQQRGAAADNRTCFARVGRSGADGGVGWPAGKSGRSNPRRAAQGRQGIGRGRAAVPRFRLVDRGAQGRCRARTKALWFARLRQVPRHHRRPGRGRRSEPDRGGQAFHGRPTLPSPSCFRIARWRRSSAARRWFSPTAGNSLD